jgi:hypothetical protein
VGECPCPALSLPFHGRSALVTPVRSLRT